MKPQCPSLGAEVNRGLKVKVWKKRTLSVTQTLSKSYFCCFFLEFLRQNDRCFASNFFPNAVVWIPLIVIRRTDDASGLSLSVTSGDLSTSRMLQRRKALTNNQAPWKHKLTQYRAHSF